MQYINGVALHNPGDCAIQALTNCFGTPYIDNLEFARRRFGYPVSSSGGVDFEAFNAWLIATAKQVCTFHGVHGCLWVSSRVDDSKAKRLYRDEVTFRTQWTGTAKHNPGHWIVTLSRGHVFALVDGVICDSYVPNPKCITWCIQNERLKML